MTIVLAVMTWPEAVSRFAGALGWIGFCFAAAWAWRGRVGR